MERVILTFEELNKATQCRGGAHSFFRPLASQAKSSQVRRISCSDRSTLVDHRSTLAYRGSHMHTAWRNTHADGAASSVTTAQPQALALLPPLPLPGRPLARPHPLPVRVTQTIRGSRALDRLRLVARCPE